MTPEQLEQFLGMAFSGIENMSNQAKAAGDNLANIANTLSQAPVPPHVAPQVAELIAELNAEAAAISQKAEDAAETGQRMQALFEQNQ